jgi:hypothetical protein
MTHFFFFVIFIFYTHFCLAEQDLLLFLQHAPTKIIQEIRDEKIKKADKEELFSGHSSRLAKKIFTRGLKQALLPSLGGFPTFYAGYLDYSDKDGTVHFPLRHTSHKLYLVVTPTFEIAPFNKNIVQNLRFPNQTTPQHEDTLEPQSLEKEAEQLRLSKEEVSELYLCERKKLDDGTLFWNVSKAPLPENRLISKLSLIILTKPKNLVVPCGTFFIDPSHQHHYFLPPIYVVGTVDQNRTLLNASELLPFFEPVNQAVTKTPNNVTQSLIKNQ